MPGMDGRKMKEVASNAMGLPPMPPIEGVEIIGLCGKAKGAKPIFSPGEKLILAKYETRIVTMIILRVEDPVS